jgi:hypothetical protein
MRRRTVLLQLAATGLALIMPNRASPGPLSGSSEPSQAEWLAEVLGPPSPGTKSPVGGLYLYRFPEPIYALTKPIGWQPSLQQHSRLTSVSVPEGFVTDFASVPRIFWSVLPRDGVYTYAAVLHDYLYWVHDRSREDADAVLLACMEEFSVEESARQAVYWSVRAGGGFAWSDNAALKKRGERRVLKLLPDDPLTRWADWKMKPDVFA